MSTWTANRASCNSVTTRSAPTRPIRPAYAVREIGGQPESLLLARRASAIPDLRLGTENRRPLGVIAARAGGAQHAPGPDHASLPGSGAPSQLQSRAAA